MDRRHWLAAIVTAPVLAAPPAAANRRGVIWQGQMGSEPAFPVRVRCAIHALQEKQALTLFVRPFPDVEQ
jgi:hypothetical protein